MQEIRAVVDKIIPDGRLARISFANQAPDLAIYSSTQFPFQRKTKYGGKNRGQNLGQLLSSVTLG
jgi:hypothetical protein